MDIRTYENGESSAIPLSVNGKEKQQLRSDVAQEIISRQPDFTDRWGLLLFLALLLLLIISTWFIQYPDIISASATLTANNAPKEIIPQQSGRLIKLWVANQQSVRRNEVIGWIESTADHASVIALSGKLDSGIQYLIERHPERLAALSRVRYYNLGELQSAYQQFTGAWQQWSDYQETGFFSRKKKLLYQDIVSLNQLNHTVLQQKELTTQEVDLAQESFNMHRSLFDGKVISPELYRNEKSKFVSKQMAIPQLRAAILSNETQQRDKQKEIAQLEHDIAQQQLIFEQALQTLKSTVDDWKKKHLLLSPVNGKVVFVKPLQENQFVSQGNVLGYINPDDAGYYAEVHLPQKNFGKILAGQAVQLRFDAYPYEEFGYVAGKLNYVSNIATDSGFLATIVLNKGLVTNHHNPIQYNNGLKAQALIITQQTRLLERFYHNFIKITEKRGR